MTDLNKQLLHAARNNDLAKVLELADQGANVAHRGPRGVTAALIFAGKNNIEAVMQLVHRNPMVLYQQNDCGQTVAIWFALLNNVDALRQLAEFDSKVLNQRTNKNDTIFSLLLNNGNEEAANELFEVLTGRELVI